jgi:periplasmic divalent cation tolerance protein
VSAGGGEHDAAAARRLVALSTVGKAEDAERIARALVERGLAACVNVVPGVVSVYRWKGAVERGEELLLVIKTRAERLGALRDALVELHPYELPELIAVPITAGYEPYLDWLDASSRRPLTG